MRREPPPQVDEKILLRILKEERVPESRINGPAENPEAKRLADSIMARANRNKA